LCLYVATGVVEAHTHTLCVCVCEREREREREREEHLDFALLIEGSLRETFLP
jgi:hypothetical protein